MFFNSHKMRSSSLMLISRNSAVTRSVKFLPVTRLISMLRLPSMVFSSLEMTCSKVMLDFLDHDSSYTRTTILRQAAVLIFHQVSNLGDEIALIHVMQSMFISKHKLHGHQHSLHATLPFCVYQA